MAGAEVGRPIQALPDVGGHIPMGHEAGDQTVDPDARRPPLDGQGLDQVDHSRLGGSRVGKAWAAGPRVGRGDIQD